MLIQAALGLLGPMLLELAVKEVAVPAAKRIVSGVASDDRSNAPRQNVAPHPADVPLLSPVRSVQVVSETPGRIRVEVVGLQNRPELVAGLTVEIGDLLGVRKVEASARTGRLLVCFDPALQTAASLVAEVDRARGRLVPTTERTARRLAAVV